MTIKAPSRFAWRWAQVKPTEKDCENCDLCGKRPLSCTDCFPHGMALKCEPCVPYRWQCMSLWNKSYLSEPITSSRLPLMACLSLNRGVVLRETQDHSELCHKCNCGIEVLSSEGGGWVNFWKVQTWLNFFFFCLALQPAVYMCMFSFSPMCVVDRENTKGAGAALHCFLLFVIREELPVR